MKLSEALKHLDGRVKPFHLAPPEARVHRDTTSEAYMAEVEAIEQQVGYELCGRYGGVKFDGTPCRNRAGKGSAHLGMGCCYMHRGSGGHPLTSFKRTAYKECYPTLAEKVRELEDDLEELDSLDHEVAVAKAILHQLEANTRAPQIERAVPRLLAVLETIGKLVSKRRGITGNLNKVLVAVAWGVIEQTVNILRGELGDGEQLGRILKRMSEEVRLALPPGK